MSQLTHFSPGCEAQGGASSVAGRLPATHCNNRSPDQRLEGGAAGRAPSWAAVAERRGAGALEGLRAEGGHQRAAGACAALLARPRGGLRLDGQEGGPPGHGSLQLTVEADRRRGLGVKRRPPSLAGAATRCCLAELSVATCAGRLGDSARTANGSCLSETHGHRGRRHTSHHANMYILYYLSLGSSHCDAAETPLAARARFYLYPCHTFIRVSVSVYKMLV